MNWQDPNHPYTAAVVAAFRFGDEMGGSGLIGPVHLLVGVADGDGDASAAIAAGGLLRQVVAADPLLRPETVWLQLQVQGTAGLLAERLGQERSAEHLLIALIDQATPEVLEALRRAGIDPAAARRATLRSLGLPDDLPTTTLKEPTPAGTIDRPALPIAELDERAWRVLCWRVGHLPMDRVRRRADWDALSSLEDRAAWRIADRFGLDDDQRYSLATHHGEHVERVAYAAKPAVVETSEQMAARYQGGRHSSVGPFDQFWRKTMPTSMIGWPTWFGNRRAGLRDKRFRLLTRAAYRGQPK